MVDVCRCAVAAADIPRSSPDLRSNARALNRCRWAHSRNEERRGIIYLKGKLGASHFSQLMMQRCVRTSQVSLTDDASEIPAETWVFVSYDQCRANSVEKMNGSYCYSVLQYTFQRIRIRISKGMAAR